MNWSLLKEYWLVIPAFILAVVVIVLRGSLGAAGKDLYEAFKLKVLRSKPPPKEVSRQFHPQDYSQESVVWAHKHKRDERLDQGYCDYLDPDSGAPVFRVVRVGDDERAEFLLLRPGAAKISDS